MGLQNAGIHSWKDGMENKGRRTRSNYERILRMSQGVRMRT